MKLHLNLKAYGATLLMRNKDGIIVLLGDVQIVIQVDISDILVYTVNIFSECGFKHLACQVENGIKYRGSVHKTMQGIECQAWDVHIPHNHSLGGQAYNNIYHGLN